MASTMTKFAPLQIPLEDVVKATDNFHDDNIIRHNPFGVAYKGRLLRSGRLMEIVAQRFDCKHGNEDLEFLTEISVLVDLKHTNLVSIIGFCDEKDEKIIITRYESNGSLGQYLNRLNLPWMQTLRISLGVARALSYLHDDEGRGYVIIHCNINSDTVLLYENQEAKLSGFEFSIKQYHKDQVCFCEHTGTMGCMDPRIEETGRVTQKSDIYSFGVILLEMLCDRKALIQNEANRFLAPLAIHHYENGTLEDIIHPDLWNQMSPESLFKYSKVAYSCLKVEQAHRPNANNIVDTLEKALETQLRHENSGKKLEHLKIRFTDIKFTTDNFSDTYKLGDGFYYTWYRGEFDLFDKRNPSSEEGKNNDGILRKRHNTVIIRRIRPRDDEQGEQVFFTELDMLTSIKHRGIVTLLGFCVEGPEMFLVTENASNGLLSYYMGNANYDKRRILSWEKRLKICIDVAHALNYLHYEMEDQKMIILGDLRSNNIFLDENWEAKIAWFGYSAFVPQNQEDDSLCLNRISTQPCTRYYIDSECEKTGKLKRESSVHSFGVFLLEVLCGRVAYDPIYLKESVKGLAHLARRSFCKGTLEDMIDPIIKEGTAENNFVLHREPNKDSLHTFIELAFQCLIETQDQRPTMKIVVKELEKALCFQEKSTENYRIPLKKALAFRGLENFEIHLSDIKLATSNFSEAYRIASRDGCTLYKAELEHFDNENASSLQGENKGQHPKRRSIVVIKRYQVGHTLYGEEQFFTEIEMLTSVNHPNIVTLLGFCVERSEMILVTPNVSNGYLYDYLVIDTPCSLTWEKRLKICIDAAHALNYLHYEMEDQQMIINRDINSCNIVLGENWLAKIVDFWWSVFLPPNQEDEALYLDWKGRLSYVDPEHKMTRKLKRESDVYGFGVVLFEILSGRLAYDPIYTKESDTGLAFVARQSFRMGTIQDIIDPMLKNKTGKPNKDSLDTFIEIAHQCVAETQDQRPTMKVVVKELEKALSFQISGGDN